MCQPHAIVSWNLSFTFWSHKPFTWSVAKYRSFSIGKLSYLTYWSPKNWCQPHSLVSNMIQNIRQHHFETNKRVNFWLYSLICSILQAQLKGQCRLMTNFETSIYKPCSLFLGCNFCISPYLMRFSRYTFANMVSSLYECVSNHTTTKISWKWFLIFCLRMACFIEDGRKWFPFIFVMTYTEIHFLSSFILFAQSAELNHFLQDSFPLQRGKNIIFLGKNPRILFFLRR